MPAVALGDIGLAGPVQLLEASTGGAWVALCDGEPRRAKLVLGSGPGELLDEILARDATGRYLVVTTGGLTELVDAVTSSRVNLTELGADVRKLRADFADHRTLSFDAAGRYLAYVRRQAGASSIVVRKLEDGTERVFSPTAAELVKITLSADARYVTFDALREDTNHNGKLDFPAPEQPAIKDACEKQPLRFRNFSYQGRGDAASRGVVTLGDGSVRDLPTLLMPLGASLLLREADGSLLLLRENKRTPLAPAGCAARVLFADAEREQIVASCSPPLPKRVKGKPLPPPSGKREVWLFGAGLAQNLQRELYETSVDREAIVGARLVPLYPGAEAGLLDLERRELQPLAAGSRVLMTNGTTALIWRDNDLYRYEAQTKREERLARGVAKNPELLQVPGAVLISPFVIVGGSGAALPSPERALALSSSGFVLTGSSDGTSDASIQGPLRWVDARVPPPDGPPR